MIRDDASLGWAWIRQGPMTVRKLKTGTSLGRVTMRTYWATGAKAGEARLVGWADSRRS
jgi:hypothetical protein